MKVLVTGVNGFVGKHLARELEKRGIEVNGLGREAKPASQIVKILAGYWPCDLMDKSAITELPLDDVGAVVNLAGLSRVGDSFANPDKYKEVNVGVHTNLLQVLAEKSLRPRVIAISTSAIYDPNQPLPLTEESKPASNMSPYALSKLEMEKSLGKFNQDGLDIIVARPFNHIGPGQEQGFLVPDLYAKLKSQIGVIKTGDLSTKRDYTDVRDVASAYADLVVANKLNYGVYNICSGKSVAGQEILDLLSNLMSMQVKAEVDPSLLRPNEIVDLYGSFERLHAETGWAPRISLVQTIKDLVASYT